MAEPAGVQGDVTHTTHTLEPKLTGLRYRGYKTQLSRTQYIAWGTYDPKTAITLRKSVFPNDITPPPASVTFEHFTLPQPSETEGLLPNHLIFPNQLEEQLAGW